MTEHPFFINKDILRRPAPPCTSAGFYLILKRVEPSIDSYFFYAIKVPIENITMLVYIDLTDQIAEPAELSSQQSSNLAAVK